MKRSLLSLITIILFVLFVCQAHAGWTDGLRAYYPFNKNTEDISGNGYNGQNYRGISFAVDRFDNTDSASEFDEETGGLIWLYYRALDNLEDFSIGFWMKTTDEGSGKYIISGAKNDTESDEFLIGHDNGSLIICIGGEFAISLAPKVNDGAWHHVMLVRDVTYVFAGIYILNDLALYIDGKPAFLPPLEVLPETFKQKLDIAAGGLWLGGDQEIVGGGFQIEKQYKGSLDDIHVYDRGLSEEEILDLSAAPLFFDGDQDCDTDSADLSLLANYFGGGTDTVSEGGPATVFDADRDGNIDGRDLELFTKYHGKEGAVLSRDADCDGYGRPYSSRCIWGLDPAVPYVADATDCDDNDGNWHMSWDSSGWMPGPLCAFAAWDCNIDCEYEDHCLPNVSDVPTSLECLHKSNDIDVNNDKFSWTVYARPGGVNDGSKRHLQSIQAFEGKPTERSEGTDKFLAVTMSDEYESSDNANVSIVRVYNMGSEDLPDDTVVYQDLLKNDSVTDVFNHAGGAQRIGEYLFVALEDFDGDCDAGECGPGKTGVWKIERDPDDLDDPGVPEVHFKYIVDLGISDRHHSAVGVTKLVDGTYLLAACVEYGCDKIRFFKSKADSLEPDPEFHFIDEWERSELYPGGDNFSDCNPQNINLVADTFSGDIYLVMFGVEGGWDCGLARNDDNIYGYRVHMLLNYQIRLEFIPSTKGEIQTGDPCNPGNQLTGTNFVAGSGLWLRPLGKDDIAILSTEHYNSCGDDAKSRWGVTENWDD